MKQRAEVFIVHYSNSQAPKHGPWLEKTHGPWPISSDSLATSSFEKTGYI